jgi:hypothetical protein
MESEPVGERDPMEEEDDPGETDRRTSLLEAQEWTEEIL